MTCSKAKQKTGSSSRGLVALADEYAESHHCGQMRNCGKLNYIIHPREVARLAGKFGFSDDKTLAIALLHDTLEDTKLTFREIERTFGSKIAEGVLMLTRDRKKSRKVYNDKIISSPTNIRIVKLCDTLHNVKTLEHLSAKSAARKIRECKDIFIPMAEELCPEIASRIKYHIKKFLRDRKKSIAKTKKKIPKKKKI